MMHYDLDKLVHDAWYSGGLVDLTGCAYGRAHWFGTSQQLAEVNTQPQSYYRFLAGLVKYSGAKRILEIGTHQGGSACAMARGHAALGLYPALDLLTVDITNDAPKLDGVPGITKLHGDACQPDVIKKICHHFGKERIDLLYIDADHSYKPTMSQFSTFVLLLRPRVIVLDDINLGDEMRRVWADIQAMPMFTSVDASTIIREIRDASCGFGLVVR